MTYAIELTIDNSEVDEQIECNNIEKIKNARCKEFEVCYDYALKDIAKKFKRRLWGCEDGYYLLEEFSSQIKIENAKVGDIITYHDINDFDSEYEKPCSGNCFHFGIIAETDGTIEGTIINSKWGEDNVYKTKICNVVTLYGNAVVIWKQVN